MKDTKKEMLDKYQQGEFKNYRNGDDPVKHPFKPLSKDLPVQPDLNTYNDILLAIKDLPPEIQQLCKRIFFHGIRSITGAGIQDIKNYVMDRPDANIYDVEDMAKTFRSGKI